MTDPPATHCDACGKETLQRIVSGGAGVLYKGEGWYVTDYSKKSSGGKDVPDKPKSESTKSDSPAKESRDTPAPKPESKPEPKPATTKKD